MIFYQSVFETNHRASDGFDHTNVFFWKTWSSGQHGTETHHSEITNNFPRKMPYEKRHNPSKIRRRLRKETFGCIEYAFMFVSENPLDDMPIHNLIFTH